jgi:hypothetical protein
MSHSPVDNGLLLLVQEFDQTPLAADKAVDTMVLGINET